MADGSQRHALGRRAADDDTTEARRRRRRLADANWEGGPPRQRWDTHSLDICSDCLFLLANGDAPAECDDRHHDHDQCKPDEGCSGVGRSIEAQWPSADGWSVMASCSNEDCGPQPGSAQNDDDCTAREGFFTWSSCDCCGSHLGGTRYHGTAMREKK